MPDPIPSQPSAERLRAALAAPVRIETDRLVLRPVAPEDAAAIAAGASRREVADTTVSIPHPYPPGGAEHYIAACQADRAAGRRLALAIEEDGVVRGVAAIRDVDPEHGAAELSFWLVPEAWGRGLMSEAVRALVAYGFDAVGLDRLYAYHMVRNPASGRVLEKAGLRREGVLRSCVRKWGQREDVALCAVLASDPR